MGNIFAASGLGDEKPHERDELVRGSMGKRPPERQNENPEAAAFHMMPALQRTTSNINTNFNLQKVQSPGYVRC